MTNDKLELGEIQDRLQFQRMIAWEVRRVSLEVDTLKAGNGRKQPPWWATPLLGITVTIILALLGLFHQSMQTNFAEIKQIAEADRAEIKRITSVQDKRTSLVSDVDDLKRRLPIAEGIGQRLPQIERQLESISTKLDRLSERRSGRGNPTDEF